jgi:hypothetical protein
MRVTARAVAVAGPALSGMRRGAEAPVAVRDGEKTIKKVIAMEIESTNHQDVAEPDLIASGVAGTGHESQNKNRITGKKRMHYHHYNISIRTRLIPRELRPVPGPVPIILSEEEGVI